MLQRLLPALWLGLLLIAGLPYVILAQPTHAAPLPDTAAPLGIITGKVTEERTGQTLSDVSVWIYQCNGERCDQYLSSRTDLTGAYAFGALREGEYKICFIDSRYVSECYDDWPFGGMGTRIAIGSDEIMKGVDAALTPRSHVRGRVSDEASGQALPDVLVTAMAWRSYRWKEEANAVTDQYGSFDLNPLEAGAYRLRFLDQDGAHAERFYKTGRSLESAENVGVGTGLVVDGIDMRLPRLGGLSGRVQSLSTSEPLKGITVTLSGWPPIEPVVTDLLGTYEFARLKEGEYTIEYTDPTHAYAHCFYSGIEGSCQPKPVQVVDGMLTESIDQAIPETGGIRATVVDAITGQPVPALVVNLYPPSYYEWVTRTTDEEGRIEVLKLEPGQYGVEVSDPAQHYLTLWPAAVTVESGRTITTSWAVLPVKAGSRHGPWAGDRCGDRGCPARYTGDPARPRVPLAHRVFVV